MEVYKKLLEYKEMLKDGVISEAEFQKLKAILFSQKMAEMGIQDEAEFEDVIRKDVFREAILMLENNTAASYREAISWLEKLGDWGNAASVIEQCRPELLELEKQEELEREEKAKEELYNSALQKLNKKTLSSHNEAIKDLESLGDWKDAKDIIEKSKNELPALEEKDAKEKQELEKKKAKTKKTITIVCIAVACAIALFLITTNIIIPNAQLNKAMSMIEAGDYDSAYDILEELGREDIIISNKYDRAMALIDKGDYEGAAKLLEGLNYNDSAEKLKLCKYEQALALINTGDYEGAAKLLEGLNYNDSAEQLKLCKYEQAMAFIESGDYSSAFSLLNNLNYKDSEEKVSLCKYELAKEAIKEKDYINAYSLLSGLKYKDSEELLKEIEPEYKKAQLMQTFSSVNDGSVITFGSYKQSSDKSAGKEPIKWIVLEHGDSGILLLSEKVIDYKDFNENKGKDSWETSDIREWLNDGFLKEAFTDEEQSIIKTVTNKNSGKDTKDKAFFLSIDEVDKYLPSYSDRKVEETEKVYAVREKIADDIGVSSVDAIESGWWLRSPGADEDTALKVTLDGYDTVALSVAYKTSGVRPAIWIGAD